MSALADLLYEHDLELSPLGWSCKCGTYGAGDGDHVDHLAAMVSAAFLIVPRSEIAESEYGVRQYRRDRASWYVEKALGRDDAIAGAKREWYDDDFEGRPRSYAVERPVFPAAQWAALTEDGDR